MTATWPEMTTERASIRAVATLARLYAELDDIEAGLARAPMWEPARELEAEAGWVRGQLERLADVWERRLVVAIVGPSGAGKSTLLNALAGRDLSTTGLERPTTRQVVGFVPSQEDAQWLRDTLGEEHVQVIVASDAPGLAHLMLLDTPDTNTVPENQALLERALEHVDLVLAVFDAGNPQLQDNLAFLAPAMRRLPPDSIVPVLNRVDRVTEAALDKELTPDLRDALRSMWGLDAPRILHVSARAALESAGFVDDEQPLHRRNEFAALQGQVLRALNRAGEAVLRRGAHATRLVDLLRQDVADRLDGGQARAAAREHLNALNARAREAAASEVLLALESGSGTSLAEGLYERLARRWWGPVGWLITVWAVALRVIGWLRTSIGRRTSAPGGELLLDRRTRDALLTAQGSLYATAWPPLGDLLVEAGFSPQVRHADLWRAHAEALAEAMVTNGEAVIEVVLDRYAHRLSLGLWQLLLNGPLIGLVVWVGVQAVAGLFYARYLGGDFFQQAGIAALVIWLAGFVLVQIVVALTLRAPLRGALARELGAAPAVAAASDLQRQLEALDDLDRTVARRMGGRGGEQTAR